MQIILRLSNPLPLVVAAAGRALSILSDRVQLGLSCSWDSLEVEFFAKAFMLRKSPAPVFERMMAVVFEKLQYRMKRMSKLMVAIVCVTLIFSAEYRNFAFLPRPHLATLLHIIFGYCRSS